MYFTEHLIIIYLSACELVLPPTLQGEHEPAMERAGKLTLHSWYLKNKKLTQPKTTTTTTTITVFKPKYLLIFVDSILLKGFTCAILMQLL